MIAPGPGYGALRDLFAIRRDPLGYMQRCHERYGDIVRLGAGRHAIHLLAHPDYADRVLRANHANYDRRTRSARALAAVAGEGILTNGGEEWRRHRLVLQPAFRHDTLGEFESLIVEEAEAMIARWGETIDVAAEMMHLTFAVAGRAFFGTDLDAEAESMERLLPRILQRTFERATAPAPLLHRLLYWREDLRFAKAKQYLDAIVDRVIAARKPDARNLLARLFVAQEGAKLTPEEVRNDTVALLLAGHETTANALAWTFYLLAQHPEIERRVIDEGDDVTIAVIQEAMRLYPPIWITERRAVDADEIGGFAIPKGSIVYVSPYVLHRHPRWWRDPETFDPSRFVGAESKNPAYIPFSAGPHHCLGSHFAMLEARLIVRTVLRARKLTLATRERIVPQPWMTLRPANGVPMRVARRAAANPE